MTRQMSGQPPTPAPVRALTAPVLRDWLRLVRRTEEITRTLVDSLNVFPVPDSDTGTNVLLTVRAACDAIRLLPASADLVQVSRAAADGAIRGARGNSGLLVSQALAALADVCAEGPDPTALRPVEIVHAYERIADTTWAAVSRPVGGTLLTVARDAAAAARTALEESEPAAPASVSTICAAAAFGAQESVVETAGLGHGPVDAGGAALMLMLTCLSDTVDTEARAELDDGADGAVELPKPCTEVAHQMLVDLVAGATHGVTGPSDAVQATSAGEFEVMYLLDATATQASALRSELERIGDSVGVVGTPDALGMGLYQVHVHTDTPRAALPRAGRARQVCVHHLHPTALAVATGWEEDEPPLPAAGRAEGDAHVVSFERLAARREKHRAARRDRSMRQHPSQLSPSVSEAERTGVITCTRAPGLIEQLARTGAVVVLHPERDGIIRAAVDLGLGRVIVLPCDSECAAHAHEAARFLAARSSVSRVRGAVEPAPVPGESVQLLVCDTDDEARVLAAAVAVAGRAEDLTTMAGRAGRAAIELRTLALSGTDAEADAVVSALDAALRPEDELTTVILGRDAMPDVGALVAEAVTHYGERVLGDPDAIEVVVHAGGQARPDVLLALE